MRFCCDCRDDFGFGLILRVGVLYLSFTCYMKASYESLEVKKKTTKRQAFIVLIK